MTSLCVFTKTLIHCVILMFMILCRSFKKFLKMPIVIVIELLIELYRAEEGLWDSSNTDYLNMDVRQAALRRIAGRLGSEVTSGNYYFYVVS